jgi:hypothetical protein
MAPHCPSPRPPRRADPSREQGFILIAAIWMLILASAIVAVLMLRGMSRAVDANAAGKALTQKLLADGAVETVMADRVFNGVRSQWWLLPAEGTVAIGDRQVPVRMSSESGRLDINEAPLELIDRALTGFGVAAGERRVVLDRLGAYRGARRVVSSFDELDTALSIASGFQAICPSGAFTFSSGLSEPRKGHQPAELARALGVATAPISQGQAEPGAVLRIQAGGADHPLIALARTANFMDDAAAILAYSAARYCQDSGAKFIF